MELIGMNRGYIHKNECHSVESALVQFKNIDIYINADFTPIISQQAGADLFTTSYNPEFMTPVENHKTHLFFNLKDVDMVRQVAPGIINGALASYITWAYKVTKKKVIIHVPKSNPFMKNLIVNALKWIDGWELVFSKNSYSSIFYVDDGSTYFTMNKDKITYLSLLWFMDSNVMLSLDTRDERGVI